MKGILITILLFPINLIRVLPWVVILMAACFFYAIGRFFMLDILKENEKE